TLERGDAAIDVVFPLVPQLDDHLGEGVELYLAEAGRLLVGWCGGLKQDRQGCVVAVLPVLGPLVGGLAHQRLARRRSAGHKFTMLGAELVVLGKKHTKLVPADGHGRRPSTIFRSSSKTSCFRSFQAARSNSAAAILSI